MCSPNHSKKNQLHNSKLQKYSITKKMKTVIIAMFSGYHFKYNANKNQRRFSHAFAFNWT